jgi:hypothetical protein
MESGELTMWLYMEEESFGRPVRPYTVQDSSWIRRRINGQCWRSTSSCRNTLLVPNKKMQLLWIGLEEINHMFKPDIQKKEKNISMCSRCVCVCVCCVCVYRRSRHRLTFPAGTMIWSTSVSCFGCKQMQATCAESSLIPPQLCGSSSRSLLVASRTGQLDISSAAHGAA